MRPDTWTEASLAEVATLHQGVGFPKELQGRSTGDLGFYKVSDISRAVVEGRDTLGPAAHCISFQEAQKLRAVAIPANAIVFARIGEAIGLNRRALLPAPALVDNNVIAVKARPEVSDRYLLHLLRTVKLRELSQATTVPAVRTSDIGAIRVPLPPSAEQQRIVSRIEELFSEIDEGERALERVGRLVERYRQSVLKAAVTGELSASWRLSLGTDRQTAVAGKAEIAGLKEAPELPTSWKWVSLGDLITRIEAGKSFTCDERPPGPNEHGLVKVSAVTWGVYDEEESKTITDAARVDLRYLIREGDFLFSRANTIELVGASVIVGRTAKKLLLSDKILRLTFSEDIKVWVDLVLKSWLGRAQIEALSTGNQESMRNIGQERIRMIQVPVPTVGERKAIEDMVARQLHALANARQQGQHQARVSAALRQSILKAAFSGQLVPQDPRDEPASALLARLAAQASDAPATPRRRGRPAGRRLSQPNPEAAG